MYLNIDTVNPKYAYLIESINIFLAFSYFLFVKQMFCLDMYRSMFNTFDSL